MSEPSQRPAIATAPISVILFAQALSTETADAVNSWQSYLDTLQRPCEIILIQETRPEVTPAVETTPPLKTLLHDRAVGFRDVLNDAIRSAQHPILVFGTCDKQYQPADLERLLKVIDQVDLV